MLRSLRRRGPATRAELAQRTGLAKATVGTIVSALGTEGAVVEEAAAPPAAVHAADPAVRWRCAAGRSSGWAWSSTSTTSRRSCSTSPARSSRARAGPPDRSGGPTPRRVLLSLAARAGARPRRPGRRLVGATVAVPALVRDDGRTIAWAPNLDVRGAGLAARLERVLPGCPVRISNDADCAAYAEAHHGAAVGVRHALYLTGTVGIGAGIIADGRLVHGGAGFAGEVGHMPVGNPEARCGCGRQGCWEASIGLHAVLAAVGMPELDTPVETARAVAARAATDRPRATWPRWVATSGSASRRWPASSTPRWSCWAGTSCRWASWCWVRHGGCSTRDWCRRCRCGPS